MAGKAERGLTAKQEAFCLEYARCWSATDAARAAGYADPGQAGWQLLRDPAVKWRLRELAKEFASEVHVESGTLLRGMLQTADLDPITLFKDTGELKDLAELPEHARKAIREFEVHTEYVGEDASGLPISRRIVKVKLYDRLKALEMLGKFKKLFNDEDDNKTKRVSVIINTSGQGKP